jgi:hypothetical protein
MSGHPSPHHWRFRPRLSIRTLMLLIVVLGMVAWGYHRWDEYRRAWDDYRREADRVDWSERMYKKGYISKNALKLEIQKFQKAKSHLGL